MNIYNNPFISGLASCCITALIETFILFWLKSKKKKTAEKISTVVVTSVIVFVIVYLLTGSIWTINNIGNNAEKSDESTITAGETGSSQGLSGYDVQGNNTFTGMSEDNNNAQGEPNAYIPNAISLLELEPYTRQPFHVGYDEYYCKDIFGNKYSNTLYSYSEQEDGECSATYRINGQYDTFAFTSGVTGKGAKGEAQIYIYGDGKLLYEKTLTCTSDSEYKELDVHGVKDLTIEMYGHQEPEVSITGFTLLCAHLWDTMLK